MTEAISARFNKMALTPIDRVMLWLWPSTRGSIEHPIYRDLVTYLYACRSSLVGGVIGIFIVMSFIAYDEQNAILSWMIAGLYIPISLVRIGHVIRFSSIPESVRNASMELHEARYALLTIMNCIIIAMMTAIVMISGGMISKMALTAAIVGVATGVAARNAALPKIVLWQTFILLAPIVAGLSMTTSTAAWMIVVLVVLFFSSMQSTAARLQKDTLEARRQAYNADRAARFDALTGLPNRLQFDASLQAAVDSGFQPNVLYIDLDRFKLINDTQGHPSGDHLLKQVSARIAGLLPADGTMLARFGGDEFVVMTAVAPALIAEQIVEACHAPFQLPTGSALIGASIGIALYETGLSAVDLVKRADLALYRAKDGGRSRAVVFESSMEHDSAKHALMEERLRVALTEGTIEVHFQPIVRLDNQKIVAAEALVRWKDAMLGQVRPDHLIALAENVGLIDVLGEYVLKTACTAAAKWDEDISIAVNISALQFRDPDRLKAAVARVLQETGLPGYRLELEITEGTMILDFDTVRDTMMDLKATGVRIALDDFGSGYCSLSYLDRIPFDKIKIDRSLVLAALQRDPTAIVIRMINEMARALNATVVVEGIETEAQALKMRQLGTGHAQGYLFGRPSDNVECYSPAITGRLTA